MKCFGSWSLMSLTIVFYDHFYALLAILLFRENTQQEKFKVTSSMVNVSGFSRKTEPIWESAHRPLMEAEIFLPSAVYKLENYKS